MSMTIMAALLEKRNRAHKAAEEIHALAIQEDRDLTSEEQMQFDRAFADVEKYTEQLEKHERLANLKDYSAIDENKTIRFGGAETNIQKRGQDEIERDYLRAFEDAIVKAQGEVSRRGFIDKIPAELRDAQNITNPADGGYLVPKEWQKRIIEAMEYYGPMLQAGRVFTTQTGAELNVPTHDATSELGAIIGEGIADSELITAVGNLKFGSFVYTSKVIPVTMELLQDAGYDVPSLVIETAASRLGRILNKHFTIGAGTTEPRGVALDAGDSGKTLTQNAITAEKLVDLEHSIDPAYRRSPGVAFMFHDSTLAAIKKLSYGSSDDRPLWLPSIRVGEPDTILGYRYWSNNDMPDLAGAGNKAVLFGDFSKYEIRRVMGMTLRRSDEQYWLKRQVAFNMICRYDARLVDTKAIKYLAVEGGSGGEGGEGGEA